MGYQKKTLMGFGYVTFAKGVTESIKVIKIIIFARLIEPAAFGIFGSIFLVYSFLDILFQLGTEIILLQKNPQEHARLLNAAWCMNVIKGGIISLLLVLSIPFAHQLYPVAPSAVLIALTSLVPLVKGAVSLSQTVNQKQLAFKRISLVSMATVFIQSIIGVLILHSFRSVTGLILVALAEACIEVASSWLFFSPRPRWQFDTAAIRSLFKQAKWVNFAGTTNYIFHQFDDFVIGKLLGAKDLGIYQMAYTIGMVPITHSAQLVSQVTLPTFTLLTHDQHRLRRAFYRTLLGLLFLTGIPVLIFFLTGEAVIRVLFGTQWLSIFPVVYVLLCFGALRAVSGLSATLLYAVQKEKWVSSITLVSCAAIIVVAVPFVRWFGILGGAYAALFGAIAALPWMLYYSYKVLYDSHTKS